MPSLPHSRAERRLPELDALRGIAILTVFGLHLLGASFGYDRLPWEGLFPGAPPSRSFFLLYPLSYGNAGVAVFFVISGFCIHLNYMRNRAHGWGSYFIRRFFRIYPPYLAIFLLFFFFWGWCRQEDAPQQFITHVLGIHNLAKGTVFGVSPAFWSIGVEIQLYLIYPVLIAIANKMGWVQALVGTGLLEGGLRLAGAIQAWSGGEALPTWVSISPFAFWFSWALGAYLAESFLQQSESWLASVPVAPFLFLALAGSWFKPLETFQFSAWALVTAVVIERLMSQTWHISEKVLKSGAWRHLVALGIVSYSFYLIHQPLMAWTWSIGNMIFPGREVHPLARAVLALGWYPVLFMLSRILYVVLEQSSIGAGKRVLNRLA